MHTALGYALAATTLPDNWPIVGKKATLLLLMEVACYLFMFPPPWVLFSPLSSAVLPSRLADVAVVVHSGHVCGLWLSSPMSLRVWHVAHAPIHHPGVYSV